MEKTVTQIKYPLYSTKGEKAGEVDLPVKIFNTETKLKTISQAVVSSQKNARPSIAQAKDRSEKRGGGRKPWRQKGTGRARHGSIRSPIWKGGGVTHGPQKEKNYSTKTNKRVKKIVLSMVLSGKLRDNEITIVEDINIKNPKTKELVSTISSLIKDKKPAKTMLVLAGSDENMRRASRNLTNIKIARGDDVNFLDVLRVKYLIITKEALGQIIKRLS